MLDDEEDRSKFEQLYEKYRAPMVHYATKIMGNSNSSEDIVDEAFIRIVNHIKKINDIDCHKTNSFIVTIVKNICFDYLRAEKREAHISYDEECDIYYRPYKKIKYNLEEVELSALVEKII